MLRWACYLASLSWPGYCTTFGRVTIARLATEADDSLYVSSVQLSTGVICLSLTTTDACMIKAYMFSCFDTILAY